MKTNNKIYSIKDETWELIKFYKPEKTVLSMINDLMYESLPEDYKIKKWQEIFQLIELEKQSYLNMDRFWSQEEDEYCFRDKKFNPLDEESVNKIKAELIETTNYIRLLDYQELVLNKIEEEKMKMRTYPIMR